MSLIDWNKAPEGATHFSPSCEDYHPCWCKWVDGSLFGWLLDGDSNWTRIRSQEQNQEKIKAMIARPTVEKWTGEGLPPVGTLCEWHGPNHDGPNGLVWGESEVVGYSPCGLFVFMQAPSCWPTVNRIDDCEFRPIRTPEQIAAEAREKAIMRMAGEVGHWWKECPFSDLPPVMAAIYDAGYRKFEIVDN